MINLWENEEGRHAMAEEPEVLEALQGAGLPQPHFHAHEILTMTILPEAVRGASYSPGRPSPPARPPSFD